MTKYIYSQDHVKSIIKKMGLSNRRFCIETGVNRGDFSRFMRGLNELSERNSEKIYAYEKAKGLYSAKKKSIFKRIVDFIKG